MTSGLRQDDSHKDDKERDDKETKPREHPKTPHGGAGVEPSGYRGENPATAGPGPTGVASPTPENKEGHINPSAPNDATVTPGSVDEK